MLRTEVSDFSHLHSGSEGKQHCREGPHVPVSSCAVPCCKAIGLFLRSVLTQDVPPL